MLDGAEARLIGSPGLGRDELVALRGACVAVIGAGMLGGQLVQHLAMLGVGQVIVDCGRVDIANLGNQGFPVASLGVPKSVARARQVAALNPHCHVRALSCRIEDLGLAALAGVDLIATGLDSRAARMWVNEISWALGTRWVDAGVDGSGRWLRGTITMYDPRRDDSPCYVCRLDAAGVAAIAKEGRRHGCPSWRRAAVPVTTPTLQASAFGAIVGGFQALQVTSALLQAGCEPAGRQLVVECDGVPRVRRLELARNPRCLFDHTPVPLRSCPGGRLADLLPRSRIRHRAGLPALRRDTRSGARDGGVHRR
jgi:molybdopterin/thiamine biosynthesis adenylyltransferase